MKNFIYLIFAMSVVASAQSNPSPNMGMPIAIPGITPGPIWAQDINSSLLIVDGHNHSPGKGVPVQPNGMNINADLAFNTHNATLLRSSRYSSQAGVLSNAADIGALYVVGNELYYNDVSGGNKIQLTLNGSVNAGAGSISGLPSGTASASFSGGTFTFQSATNTAANVDGRNFILRNSSASSKGLTLQPPAAMGSNFSETLPALPGATSIMQMDTSGNMTAALVVDNSTLQNSGTVLSVKDAGITLAKLAAALIQYLTPSGVIEAYGGTSAPTGWLLCDGSSYLRATYPDLFTAIGTAFGAADGTHFNVPDFRGRFLRGRDGATGRDPNAGTRTAMNTGGNTGDNVGSIEADALASHTHTATMNRTNTTSGVATPGVDVMTNSTFVSTTTGAVAISSTGGSETRPINAYVNYIIKF